MIVRMWEIRAYPNHFPELLNWVSDIAVPGLEIQPNHVSSEVFSSTDGRIVVISRWHGTPTPLPDPPAALVARSAHAWDFTPVDR
ncbi:hypothetical protein F4553_004914 [Allocatelliglobosispora scoriae]|uniref:ABM domain-containing protein n=1 Tax=Allocatelliglobosispora scoriae TaxID=643052 RepID=A0A841BV23_9ACTN|nr:hypothetical protein [Allocatelliglobosispora scoriae]MBB5871535.1 hypothetical protein [Allocatelliglobosispora scoriae]